MPSQTYIVRAHARTVYTTPITFVCGKCEQMTTRQCYPGKRPIYCLKCSPRRDRSNTKNNNTEKGVFVPTHYLITPSGKKTEICLERSPQPSWYWVRTALDWFSGESIIKYSKQQGLYNYDQPLEGYYLEPIPEEELPNTQAIKLEPPKPVAPETQPTPFATKPSPLPRGRRGSSSAPIVQRLYSGREVCKRFQCGDRLLGKVRSAPNFAQWSRERDPQGITWEFRQDKYYPISLDG